jgi:hypothetical protein
MKIDDENKYDWIDRYLENELNEAELIFFEQEKANNPDFASQVNRQLEAQKNLERFLRESTTRQEADFLLRDNKTLIDSLTQESSKAVPLRPMIGNHKYWQMAAAALFGLLALTYGVFYYFDFFRQPEIVKIPVDSLKQKIVEKPIHKDNQDSVSKLKTPNPQIADNQKVIKESPWRIEQIEELILKKTMGYAGNNNREKTSRPMKIYAQSPLEKPTENQIIYRLTDTLQIYGIRDTRLLRLLYREELAKYFLIVQNDTFSLNYRTRKWQLLKKN